jgi:serine/threonine protein kinase
VTTGPDRAALEALVAACIEALERGEAAPAARICAECPDLLPAVQRRLSQLAERGLLPAGAGTQPAAVGPYRVVRALGSGGMGTVWLAEQEQPVRRLCAVKVVKAGMDTHEVLARFEAERQALAAMNHPHIAQVFDAGSTAEGRPYFAMEYVEGEPVGLFCARRRLSVEARVRLVVAVCRAVHHAHDRGFVHRDLKPSNVLVAEHDGVLTPKIIDFGIAKATAATSGEGATRLDQLLGTPEYMSPEQARTGGRFVDARADVWSLGVVLYELLCGELPWSPHRLRLGGRDELERILLHELPTAPSRRRRRGDTATTVGDAVGDRTPARRRIAGELDWITLRALGKRPEDRYPTALAFAEDLERWLRHEPVHAAPPAHTYRLRKFVRRHRSAAVAATLVAVFGGGAVALWAAGRRDDVASAAAVAEARFDEAKRAADRLFERANDPRLRGVSQNDAMRQALVADALAFYDRWLRERPSDPGLRRRRIDALIALSQVHWQLGQVADAERTAEEAVADARRLLADAPADATGRPFVAEAVRRLGRARFLARQVEPAHALLTEAVQLFELCFAAAPHAHGLSLSSCLRELASACLQSDRLDDALVATRRSIEVLEGLQALGSKDPVVGRDLGIARGALVDPLLRRGGLDEAEVVLARATAELDRLTTDRARVAALVHHGAARVARARRDAAAAVHHLEAAVAAAAQWCVDEPGRLQPAISFGDYLEDLVEAHERGGAFAAADAVWQRRIELAETMVRTFPADRQQPTTLVRVLADAAQAALDRWRRPALELAAVRAARALELVTTSPDAAGMAAQRWYFPTLVGRIGDARGDDTAAAWEALAAQLPTEVPAAAQHRDQIVEAWFCIGTSRWGRGDLPGAEAAVAHGERQVDGAAANAGRQRADLAWLRARVATRRGDHAGALAAVEQLLDHRGTWLGRWRAGDCLVDIAALPTLPAAEAAPLRERAADLFAAVIAELTPVVEREPDDPWQVVPFGFVHLQSARLAAAAGDEAGARAHLAIGVPALERIASDVHRDVWNEAVWLAARELAQRSPNGK